MIKASMHRVRCIFLLYFLIVLSGCTLWMGYEVAELNPELPQQPQAPRPAGTLLQSQFRIGISPDYMPLAYKDPVGGLVGVEVDFANRLGKELGKQIVFVEMPFPELIPALTDRRVDIIMSGMSVTSERTQLVNFTDSYATIGQMALIRANSKANFPDVRAFTTLNGKVGFVRTTTGEMAAKAFFPRATLEPQVTIEDGVAALRKGDIEVFIHDAPTIWRIVGTGGNSELAGLFWPLTKEPLAWAVRKDDEPLRFALNRQLDQWRATGTLKEILSRWVSLRIW